MIAVSVTGAVPTNTNYEPMNYVASYGVRRNLARAGSVGLSESCDGK